MKNREEATSAGEVSPARVFARPTADRLWLGPTQMSALSQLSRPVAVRVLLGPKSSGRSSLLRSLAAHSDSKLCALPLTGPKRQRSSVIKNLLQSAGLDAKGLKLEGRRELLRVFIRERLSQGQQVLLLVDDAEGFGPAAFEELSNLKDDIQLGEQSLHLLLTLEHLDHGSSPAADFIRHTCNPGITVLSWMSTTEVSWYLNWRLDAFGLAGLFSADAIRQVARITQGCFIAVDHLCQMALLLQRQGSGETINRELIFEAFALLGGHPLQPVTDKRSVPTDADSVELVVSRDGQFVRRVQFTERVMIGRSQFSDIQLKEKHLSRSHVAIVRRAHGFHLSDLNSVNGVLLNGTKVNTAQLADGDVIQIGSYQLKTHLHGLRAARTVDFDPAAMTETSTMPAPRTSEPARLRVVK